MPLFSSKVLSGVKLIKEEDSRGRSDAIKVGLTFQAQLHFNNQSVVSLPFARVTASEIPLVELTLHKHDNVIINFNVVLIMTRLSISGPLFKNFSTKLDFLGDLPSFHN